MKEQIIRNLVEIVGDEYISTRDDILLAYSCTASMGVEPVRPGAVVRPADAEEVARILRLANKHKISVTPRSGGSSLQAEALPKEDGLVIDMLRLREIEIFEDLRTARVGAGVTFGMLDKALGERGLWVPVYPESALTCTVAGNVAVNGAGPGSSAYGSIAEMVIGLEVVLPNGEIIQTGSEANPHAKGPFLRYAFGPDITGLFIGSLGSLGIITAVSVKIYKKMKHLYYQTYGFDKREDAQEFVGQLKLNDIKTLFMSLYEGRILQFFMDMLGSEYGIPEHEWPPYTISLIIGRSREELLDSDVETTKEICKSLEGHVIGISELPQGEWEDRMWSFARSCYAHGFWWRTLYHHQTPSNWHRSVEEIWAVMDEYGFLGHTAGFATGHTSVNMYPHLYWDPIDQEEEDKVVTAHQDLAQRLFKTGAVPFKLAPYWLEGVDEMDDYLELVRTIKKAIDPNNIMNPGVLGGV